MGNAGRALVLASLALLFVLAASTSFALVSGTSAALHVADHFLTSSPETSVRVDRSADVDMRQEKYIVRGATVIHAIRHLESSGVPVQVEGTTYFPQPAPSLPGSENTDPGVFPSMPDERSGTFGINPNDWYSASFVYSPDGQIVRATFVRA